MRNHGFPIFLLTLIPLVAKSSVPCADKLNDCSRFTGKGPLGGGCESHVEYMREMCASSCGYCTGDGASPAMLSMERLFLPGSLSGLDVRKVSSKGVRQWHFFELPTGNGSKDTCLASGDCDSPLVTHIMAAHFYDSLGHNLHSPIYRWSSVANGFLEHQLLRTVGAWDISTFCIGDAWFLAIANFYDGSTRQLNSTVYRWNLQKDEFDFYQSLPTVGAMDVEFVSLVEQAFLVFTGKNDDGKRDGMSECVLYRWESDDDVFQKFQTLETTGGYDAEFFTVENASLILVIVHELQTDVYKALAEDLHSGGNGFVHIQTLPIPYARDAEYLWIDGVHLITLAVFRNDETYETDSFIYSWHTAHGKLESIQQFPGGRGAIDAEYLNSSSGQLLLMASQQDGLTRMYQLNPGSVETKILEVENSSWVTPRVYDLAWHYVREAGIYLIGVARFGD